MLGVRQWRHVALSNGAFRVSRQDIGKIDFAADDQRFAMYDAFI